MNRWTALFLVIAGVLIAVPAGAACTAAHYSTRLNTQNYMGFCNVKAYGGADCTEPDGSQSNAVFDLYLRITSGWTGEMASNTNICSGNTCLIDTEYPSGPRHCFVAQMWVNIIDADTDQHLVDEDIGSGTECCDGSLGT